MENYKPSLFTLLKKAWNEWRAESKEQKRMREYMETITLHSKETGSFLRATTETNVMQAYFKACKAKEAEVAKNVRAMVFGASDQEKTALKASLMSLGIDLDSIMGEADAADGLVKTTGTPLDPKAQYDVMQAERTRKAIYVDIGDMSREEAEDYIESIIAKGKTKLYDPRKSVSGATTDDIPYNKAEEFTKSVWPEVIHSGQLSLEQTAEALLTGGNFAKSAEKTNAVVQATWDKLSDDLNGEFDGLIRTTETDYVEEGYEWPTTDTVSIDQMPEGTTFTPTAEKEYIETAVAALDDKIASPEPSSSSEEQK